MGIPFSFGQRFLYDQHQRFVRSGLPVYLRIKNFKEDEEDGTSSDYLEVGMPFTPSGAAGVATGVIDILIDPPPAVVTMSKYTAKNLGLDLTKLNFGSKVFHVSHTFVINQLTELLLTDGYAVWRNRDGHKVIGLVYNNRLYSIEAINHSEVAGEIVSWTLAGNALETEISNAGG